MKQRHPDSIAGCCEIDVKDRQLIDDAATDTGKSDSELLLLNVAGMRCMNCARKIESILLKNLGVKRVEVNLTNGTVTIVRDPARASVGDLKALVKAAGYTVCDIASDEATDSGIRDGSEDYFIQWKHYSFGALAAFGIVGFYLGLITLTSDWFFAKTQFGEYRWWLLALALGLGVQVTLYAFLRSRLNRNAIKGAKKCLVASGGTSTAAMAACCAHYIVAFLPALGLPFLSAAAAGLARYQSLFFFVGVLSNLFGIGMMLRLLIKNGIVKITTRRCFLKYGLRWA